MKNQVNKKEYAINKFVKYAKEDYGVVKYDKGLLIVSKDPKAKVECVFGAYNGQVISKPLNIEGLPNDIVKGFEQIIEDQKEQYEKFNLAGAPTLETISKELKDDIAKYGKTKFVNQYEGYTKAMLARALEVALQEKIYLMGNVQVSVFKMGKEHYGDIDLKNSETFQRLAKKGLASEQIVSMQELKDNIGMDQTKAWLCLLTAWCDIKGRKYFVSKQAIDTVYENIHGKELKGDLELFDLHNIEGGAVKWINKIEKREISYYEHVAFFDVLLNAYDKGIIKGFYVLVDGEPTIENLEKVKKEYPTITSDTIAQLTGNDDKDFIYEVKNALKKFDQIMWQKEGYIGDKEAVFIVRPVGLNKRGQDSITRLIYHTTFFTTWQTSAKQEARSGL